ncbi:hypothetical protein RHCRD62_40096 [Rhodococcus sp. RD6.2]|nr:hypothetical protein RHCRD62_40096 [Rhodococcus sp. RD6.2]
MVPGSAIRVWPRPMPAATSVGPPTAMVPTTPPIPAPVTVPTAGITKVPTTAPMMVPSRPPEAVATASCEVKVCCALRFSSGEAMSLIARPAPLIGCAVALPEIDLALPRSKTGVRVTVLPSSLIFWSIGNCRVLSWNASGRLTTALPRPSCSSMFLPSPDTLNAPASMVVTTDVPSIFEFQSMVSGAGLALAVPTLTPSAAIASIDVTADFLSFIRYIPSGMTRGLARKDTATHAH